MRYIMDEKEFLFRFVDYIRANEAPLWNDLIKDFLTEHHKNYKGVYWYKVGVSEREQIKEQVRIKLKEFLEFLPITLDSNYQDIIVDSYLKEKNF